MSASIGRGEHLGRERERRPLQLEGRQALAQPAPCRQQLLHLLDRRTRKEVRPQPFAQTIQRQARAVDPIRLRVTPGPRQLRLADIHPQHRPSTPRAPLRSIARPTSRRRSDSSSALRQVTRPAHFARPSRCPGGHDLQAVTLSPHHRTTTTIQGPPTSPLPLEAEADTAYSGPASRSPLRAAARLRLFRLDHVGYRDGLLRQLDFSRSGGIAERVSQVLKDLAREFHDIVGVSAGVGSLVPPQLAPDHGQGVGKGRMGLAIPPGLPDARRPRAEPVGVRPG